VRPNVLESNDLKWPDVFPLVRNEVVRWGGQVMALPLGIDPSTIDSSTKPSAISLLAVVAPRAISNERLGVLFDSESMKPRITEPPFVESLLLLQKSSANSDDRTAERARADEPNVPVLGYNDRLIGVTATSRNAASAFKLMAWLAQADTCSQLAQIGRSLLPARRSLASSTAWYDASIGASERNERGKTLDAALSGERSLAIPRISGVDEYLAALDDAVNAAVTDKATPTAALQKAADRWEKITSARGLDQQRQAYQKHLGIRD
jgi:ABC-type glycerol-3-phosphate transport system substrate-binding protein